MPMRPVRFWLVCLFFLLWAGVILLELFWLQVVRHSYFMDQARRQQQRTIEVDPRRGNLYDRNLHELAMTVQVESIYAVPSEVGDREAAAATLAGVVHTDAADSETSEAEIARRLNEGRPFVWVARRVSAGAASQVRALNLRGVYLRSEYQRFYPNGLMASQLLGYVGISGGGLGGLEQRFDGRLHGTPGHSLAAVDARRHVLGSNENEPEPGQSLVLTIDENIQYMAEKVLARAMKRNLAANGTIVVQDVHTGQILALATRPGFDPNDLRHVDPALLHDHAVSDVYEPGSVFKLVTYSAALESHTARPGDSIDCQGGQITLAGRVIHDDESERGMRVVPVATALARSSNVAAVKLALKVGPERLYGFIRGFGFGTRTGLEVPAETRGLLRPVDKWGSSSIASIAIGQEVGVTPVQLVSMVSTIANGGVYLPARVLMPNQPGSRQEDDGAAPSDLPRPFRIHAELPDPLPAGAHRVISEMTAAEMRRMMEGVVLYGTGKPAQLDGYSSGGKTGTAQKIDDRTHRYSKTMRIASFAGMAPVNNPVIAVAVVIDSPQGASYYGTAVAAPVFAELAQQVLEYLGVPHDIDLRPPPAPGSGMRPVTEDDLGPSQEDASQLLAATNDLPPDDPLRSGPPRSPDAHPEQAPRPASPLVLAPAGAGSAHPPAPPPQLRMAGRGDDGSRTVPSMIGLPMRKVIEAGASAGLDVEITGSGTAREQSPAAGTRVPAGTKIVVHCGR